MAEEFAAATVRATLGNDPRRIRLARLLGLQVGAPRAVGAEINPPLFPRVVFARGEAGERGRGAERRALLVKKPDNCKG